MDYDLAQSDDFGDMAETPDVPEVPEIDDVPEPPEAPDVSETPDVPEIPETPEIPDNEEPEDPTFHPQPGGHETLPNVEGEPLLTPHIPEVPYGGRGPEGGPRGGFG